MFQSDEWLRRLNWEIKARDPLLYATRVGSKVVIYRKAQKNLYGLIEGHDRLDRPSHFILALTDTWKLIGKPVNYGIMPVLEQLNRMDGHLRDDYWERRKERDRQDHLRQVSRHHEFRARAADARKDFARATNDINTSILAKKDRRRLKGA